MNASDRVIAILEKMMTKSDDNRKTIQELSDAIQARRKVIHDKTDANQM
jgi:hypothetical protein